MTHHDTEIDPLITRQLLGECTAEESKQLEAWIKASPKHARQYAVEAYLFRCIEDKIAGANHANELALQESLTIMGRVRQRPWVGLAAALMLMASIAVMVLISQGTTDHPATVTEVVGTPALTTGLVPQGVIKMAEGAAALKFSSTAEVILEAPCQFEVVDGATLRLLEGKATVLCASQAAHGFTIKTPTCTLVDLGTEFGVSVDPGGQTQAVVFTGEIQVQSPRSGVAQLQAGDAWRVDPSGAGRALAMADAPAFLRRGDFALLARSTPDGDAAGWASAGKALTDDPTLQMWIDMNPVGSSLGLINHADPTSPLIRRADGSPLPTTAGRFDGDTALRFEQPGDALRIELPGQFEALTYAAWVKIDVPSEPLEHRGLVMSERWGNRGQVHWQIKGNDFRLSFFDKGDEIDPRYPASPQGLMDGGWQLLVSVIDRQAKEVRHYLDGKSVDRRTIDQALPPLQIGKAWVGGWQPGDGDAIRPLRGEIDDILIWSRALSSVEIAWLYERSH